MFDFIVDVLEVTIGVVIADQLVKRGPAIMAKVKESQVKLNAAIAERTHPANAVQVEA